MTVGLPEAEGRLAPEAAGTARERAGAAGCVVLGPGLGRERGAIELARELAATIEAPLLIDADGLYAHNERLEELAGRAAPIVLTPHAGELARLLGSDSDAVAAARLDCAREVARRSGAVVVLKGDDTIVTDGERVAVNALSCPALATAGTGDVLSGTIAALIARGLDPFTGACAGVLAHARAGTLAAERHGAESVIATDVIEALPAGLARR
jgi:ADP-dependent NAD(P)H-hydrate dehydratase / NAD(P)H-hydrate epimerase